MSLLAPRRSRLDLTTARAWVGRHRRLSVGVVVALVLVVVFPFAGGAIAGRVAVTKLEERLGLPVQIGHVRAGLLGLTFRDIQIGQPGAGDARGASPPLVQVRRVRVPYWAALFRRGVVAIDGVVADVRRGGPDDNVQAALDKLRERRKQSEAADQAGAGAGRLPGVTITDGKATLRDSGTSLGVSIGHFDGAFLPGDHVELNLGQLDGLLAFGGPDRGARFGAKTISVAGPLTGARPRGYPTLTVAGGFATPLPSLSLTGIQGKIHPAAPPGTDPADVHQLVVDLDGSYGGARETLWTARGGLDPKAREGQLSLRAERFSLGEIAEVLPKNILDPKRTNVDAAFDVSWADGAVRFGGDMQVNGLSVEHKGLASEAIRDLDLGLIVRGTAFPESRRVSFDRLEGRLHDLVGTISGFVELAPGTFTFADGSKLGFLPRLELTLEVPKLPCAKLLASMPPALVPALQGFVLQGQFGAEIETHIDYADLENMDLHGKIGIDGCRVMKAPPEVKQLITGESIAHTVEVPKGPNAKGAAPGETEDMQFVIGPENPDFVPYEQISPNLVASITTTEDGGFFKHRGWVTSEFKTALRRNLQRGGFRGGASSITMQMVKNVLLSQEKTLSRKLQELFLVWYLEQELPKERILELYFNAIEFGPRIYGIGPAAHHYFGKAASDLTPLEAAFFSSMLPSPKRRYIQYCHGALYPPWEKYVHRILNKVHERGRIDDEQYEEFANQKLVFDRNETNFSERQCLDWVKRITARPGKETPDEEAPTDVDVADDGDTGPLPVGKLKRLFARGNHHGGGAAARHGDDGKTGGASKGGAAPADDNP